MLRIVLMNLFCNSLGTDVMIIDDYRQSKLLYQCIYHGISVGNKFTVNSLFIEENSERTVDY